MFFAGLLSGGRSDGFPFGLLAAGLLASGLLASGLLVFTRGVRGASFQGEVHAFSAITSGHDGFAGRRLSAFIIATALVLPAAAGQYAESLFRVQWDAFAGLDGETSRVRPDEISGSSGFSQVIGPQSEPQEVQLPPVSMQRAMTGSCSFVPQ
jgi:hypothetical protein